MRLQVYKNRLGVAWPTNKKERGACKRAGFLPRKAVDGRLAYVTPHVDCLELLDKSPVVAAWRREAERRYTRSGDDGEGLESDGSGLYLFQQAGVRELVARESPFLGDEMGLGKTVQVARYIELEQPKSICIICPATLKLNWRRELLGWTNLPESDIQICEGRQAGRLAARVNIINFDICKAWRDELHRKGWGVVVVDEAHLLKSRKADRTKVICGEGSPATGVRAEKRIALSGTPITNRVRDLWPILRWLQPYGWQSFWAFAKQFCAARRTPFGWVNDGASQEELLNWRLRSTCLVRREKKQVLKDLPKKFRKVLVVGGQCARIAAEEERLTGGFSEVDRVLEGLEKRKVGFEQLSEVRKEMGLAKLPFAKKVIRQTLESQEKIVVFFWTVEVGQALLGTHPSSAYVSGSVLSAKRDKEVLRFQTDPECRIFLAQIAAAGVGLTLTAADTAIFVEQDWSPSNLVQAEDRLHRIGQAKNVLCQYIVADGSIDKRIVELLADKEETTEEVLR